MGVPLDARKEGFEQKNVFSPFVFYELTSFRKSWCTRAKLLGLCFFECSVSCKNEYLHHLPGTGSRYVVGHAFRFLTFEKTGPESSPPPTPLFCVRSVSHLHFGLIATGLLRSQKGAATTSELLPFKPFKNHASKTSLEHRALSIATRVPMRNALFYWVS